MRPADDDPQQTVSSEETPNTSPFEGVEDSVALPDLGVIGAAAETAQAETNPAKNASEKPLSARDRLSSRTREARPRKKRGGLIAAIVLLVIVIGIVGTAIGGIAYLRWYAHDDALDFQGTWYVAGTETPIEITADSIQLTESVAYRYKLNTHDKTITLTIGNMIGHGSYRFSLDRTQLVIFDGRSNPDEVLESDVRWLVQALYDDLMDEPNDVTSGIRRNRTLLTREPNTAPISTTPASTESSDASTDGSGEAHTVWSAEDWLNGTSGDSNAADGSGTNDDPAGTTTTNTASNANDVDSLLQGINDLPAIDAANAEDAAS